jgi:hypothetical protein
VERALQAQVVPAEAGLLVDAVALDSAGCLRSFGTRTPG